MSKLRVPAMVLLFTVAAMLEATRLTSLSAISNSDVWWHLCSGTWILQRHAFPHTGIFSQSAALPWSASSWAYDVLLALTYKLLGLRSIPVLLMCFKVGLAVITFLLATGLRGSFWPAVGLSALAQYILGGVQPTPVYFSILFLAVELLLLLETRRTHNPRLLFWLPAIFLLWANVDVRFVYGLALLVLYLAAAIFDSHIASEEHSVSMRAAGLAIVLSGIATVATPYFWHSYAAFFSSVSGSGGSYFPDFQAMTFHQPQDYLLLLLAMGAFLAMGFRRSRDPFLIALLAGSAILSFHAQRDIWIVTLAAVALIGGAIAPEPEETEIVSARAAWSTAGLVTVVLIAAGLQVPRSREALIARVGESYPVQAGAFIRQHQLPQPLFNAYEWGGFLDWYLPEYPVAIDGRPELYGDDFIAEYSQVINADAPYSALPAMNDARTLLLPAKSLMGKALTNVPAFKVAYSDAVAVVLTRQE